MVKKQLGLCTLILIGLLVVEGVVGQDTLVRSKDLAFAQVAVGGGLETVINITNRGESTYSGNLYFRHGNNLDWNPTVNGTPVTLGVLPVSISSGATVTLRVTGTEIHTGFAVLYANNLNFTSVLEGNLTYYIKSGQTVLDSVGIAPSRELYQTSIAFDNFSTIVLALANLSQSTTATITFDLFNANGFWVTTSQVFLSPRMHTAQYLTELFNQAGTQAGKVEISSFPVPFIGTAGTLVGGELSALPLEASPITYDMSGTVGTGTFLGQVVIWVEGELVQGFVTFTRFNQQNVIETYPLAGQLVPWEMRLGFYGSGPSFGNVDTVAYILIPQFSFSAQTLNANYAAFIVGDNYAPAGTIVLTKTTD